MDSSARRALRIDGKVKQLRSTNVAELSHQFLKSFFDEGHLLGCSPNAPKISSNSR